MKMRAVRVWGTLASAVVVLPLTACGSGAPGAEGATEDDVGEVSLALTTVPAGVACIRVTATGTTTQDFTVAAGGSSVLSLGRLPLGTVSVTANAYSVACASIGTTAPSWVSDPLSVNVRAGIVSTLNLSLRQNNPVTANVNFIGNVTHVSAGNSFVLVTFSDGTVKFTGSNPFNGVAMTLTPMPSLTNVVETAGGSQHACARKADGTVWCWGSNQYGQLGSGALGGSQTNPVQVPGIANATQLALGAYFSCAVDNVFNLYCWGRNNAGQLGNGTTTDRVAPAIVAGVGPERVAAGYQHICTQGMSWLYCWGDNQFGQLGDGTTTSQLTPKFITGAHAFISMAAGGSHTCGVRGDNTVRCWGYNGDGEVGDGTTTHRSLPTAVLNITDATQVAAGSSQTCVRRQSGAVSCWGRSMYGAIGNGSADTFSTPVTVPGVAGATSVVMSELMESVIAPLDNQSILGWGQDQNGQLGDGSRGFRFRPVNMLVQ